MAAVVLFFHHGGASQRWSVNEDGTVSPYDDPSLCIGARQLSGRMAAVEGGALSLTLVELGSSEAVTFPHLVEGADIREAAVALRNDALGSSSIPGALRGPARDGPSGDPSSPSAPEFSRQRSFHAHSNASLRQDTRPQSHLDFLHDTSLPQPSSFEADESVMGTTRGSSWVFPPEIEAPSRRRSRGLGALAADSGLGHAPFAPPRAVPSQHIPSSSGDMQWFTAAFRTILNHSIRCLSRAADGYCTQEVLRHVRALAVLVESSPRGCVTQQHKEMVRALPEAVAEGAASCNWSRDVAADYGVLLRLCNENMRT